jgi:hypothetical protein
MVEDDSDDPHHAKMSGHQIPLPVLGILRHNELCYFDEAWLLREFPEYVAADDILTGMEMFDDDGGHWRVRAVRRVSPAPGPRRWWQFWPFWKAPNAIPDFELDRLGDVDFKTVRHRVIKLTKVAMADDDPEDRREVLANVRRAERLEDIAEELALTDSMGFFN